MLICIGLITNQMQSPLDSLPQHHYLEFGHNSPKSSWIKSRVQKESFNYAEYDATYIKNLF